MLVENVLQMVNNYLINKGLDERRMAAAAAKNTNLSATYYTDHIDQFDLQAPFRLIFVCNIEVATQKSPNYVPFIR